MTKQDYINARKRTCCICGKNFEGWGNNPAPVKDEGVCCDDCNATRVIPARIAQLSRRNEE